MCWCYFNQACQSVLHLDLLISRSALVLHTIRYPTHLLPLMGELPNTHVCIKADHFPRRYIWDVWCWLKVLKVCPVVGAPYGYSQERPWVINMLTTPGPSPGLYLPSTDVALFLEHMEIGVLYPGAAARGNCRLSSWPHRAIVSALHLIVELTLTLGL